MSSVKLVKIIKLLLYCLALTPLIITPMTIFPFNFGRGLVAQFFMEIIFGLYLALAVGGKNYQPRKNILSAAAGLFIFFLFISSVFGVHFFKSFWGNEERFSGWFYLLHAFAAFLVLPAIFKNKEEWKRFLGFNVFAGLAMFAIAILSLFGVKFWGVDLGLRIAGTMGNPLFLGTYFIIIFALALYLAASAQNLKIKILWFVCSAIIFYGIVLTQSRGALYGTLLGALAGFFYYGFFNKRKRVRIAAAFLVLIVLAAMGVIFIFRNSAFVKNSSLLSRFADFSLTAGTANTRLMGWRIALAAIKERPILGWGMEGFDVAFNKYYNPQLLKYSYYETWFDRPHNKVLETAVDGGAIGLLFYLLIFPAAGREIRRKEKNGWFSTSHAAVLAGGLVAYFAQNLFIFDTAVSYVLFVTLLAFIASEHREGNAPEKIPLSPVLFFLGLSLASGWFTSVSPFLASAELRGDVSVTEADNTKKADLDGYKRAMQLFNPYQEEWRIDLAKSVIISLKRGNGLYSAAEINFVVEELKKNTIEYPTSAYYHMLLGSLYAELVGQDKKYFDLAKSELDEALRLSPQRQHIYFSYGRLYGLAKDKDNLIKSFNRAIELEPKAAISYWEAGKELYLLDPKDNLAKAWIIKSAEMGYFPDTNGEFIFIFKNFYDYFLQNKNYQVLSQFYARMAAIEPHKASWHAQNATAMYMLKKYDEAMAEIRAAMALDGSYKEEGEKFIQIIEKEK